MELLVQLTWRVEASPHESDHVQYQCEAALKSTQISYKNAVLHHPEYDILRPIIRIALPSMAIPKHDRPERDEHIIVLTMSMLRNLVEIGARNFEATGIDREKNEHSRSETVSSLEKSDVFNLIVALAAGTTDEYEKIDCLLLEIIYHLLKGVNVNDILAGTAEIRAVRSITSTLTFRNRSMI